MSVREDSLAASTAVEIQRIHVPADCVFKLYGVEVWEDQTPGSSDAVCELRFTEDSSITEFTGNNYASKDSPLLFKQANGSGDEYIRVFVENKDSVDAHDIAANLQYALMGGADS